MEIIVTLLGVIIIINALFVFTEEDESKNFLFGIMSVFVITLVLWFGLTETKDVELQIHEATSNDKSFSYYVDNESRIIPIPNNAVKVVKTEPRAWSIALDKYEVIVK